MGGGRFKTTSQYRGLWQKQGLLVTKGIITRFIKIIYLYNMSMSKIYVAVTCKTVKTEVSVSLSQMQNG